MFLDWKINELTRLFGVLRNAFYFIYKIHIIETLNLRSKNDCKLSWLDRLSVIS